MKIIALLLLLIIPLRDKKISTSNWDYVYVPSLVPIHNKKLYVPPLLNETWAIYNIDHSEYPMWYKVSGLRTEGIIYLTIQETEKEFIWRIYTIDVEYAHYNLKIAFGEEYDPDVDYWSEQKRVEIVRNEKIMRFPKNIRELPK